MAGEASICEECGASIYKEHLDARIARYEAGKLLCPHCVEEFESKHDASGKNNVELIEPIALDAEDMAEPAGGQTRITAFGSDGTAIGATSQWDDSSFKRKLAPDKPGASRCRIFHSKLNDGAISFMTQQINNWIDENPNISIKTSHATIGIWEGKHADPNLILTLFY
jgi:hypothetical protein